MGIRHSDTGITSPDNPARQVSRTKYLEDHVVDEGSITAAMLVEGVGSLPARQEATYTTASLADAAAESGSVTLGKSYRVLRVEADRACRVRLYTTAAKRDADGARAVGADPNGDHGCVLDVVLTGAMLSLELSPQANGSSGDDPATSTAYITVTNLSGGASTVAATLTYLSQEA